MNYLILQHPGHNRVYYNLADKLAIAELKLASKRLSGNCKSIKIIEIEDIRYLSIETDEALSDNDMQIVSRLSFVFAIYILEEINGKNVFITIKKNRYEYLNGKISSLLKYKGKTNELFTKMMINVALLSSDFDYFDNIQMLDPVAGRGTTLFEGTVYGFDTYGIEIDSKSVHEGIIFFKKFIQTERIKYQSGQRQIYSTNKRDIVNIYEFKYANTKEDFKAQKNSKTLGVINGKSQDSFKYFKKDKFHLIVGDLPYGILHGNKGGKNPTSKTRNPSDLLKECLHEWYKVMKKGACAVIAWNSFIVSRHKLKHIFEAHGFKVLSDEPYNEFEHMVDNSIKRDIIVAKKV